MSLMTDRQISLSSLDVANPRPQLTGVGGSFSVPLLLFSAVVILLHPFYSADWRVKRVLRQRFWSEVDGNWD